ncbi:hypothetical protein [Collimonas pratensis]|uniref:NHL repeat family protein n=1 Tax=Collimonas pratensis TaxID=279113 RepID=A0ABN4MCT7_9BURK|nr:hypothetical protein [Collimonas pratensis]AMP15681.1 NHL repeat family protein [Collimonas pratensis]
MRPYIRSSLVLALISILAACGGGGDSSGTATPANTTTTAATTPAVVPNGSTITMTQNNSVLVPAGTTVTSPNGSVVTVNGTSNTIYTQVGATVSVPANATGPANNLVSTGQAPSGAVATSAITVTEVAGSATNNQTQVDGVGAAAVFWGGGHIALAPNGNIIVSDRNVVRTVTQAGAVTTLAPTGQAASWEGIAVDSNGNIFGDGSSGLLSMQPATWGSSINELSTAGIVKSFAANWNITTNFNAISIGGLAIDSSGNIYLADGPNNRVVKFTANGIMSILAGNGSSGNSDGTGTAATLNNPLDLAIDTSGNLYFTDSSSNPQKSTIRKITANGTVSTVATLGVLGTAIAVSPSGNIYTADGYANIVRLDPKGNVTTFSTGISSGFITSMVADSSGNLFVDTRGSGAQILKISF